MTEERGPRVRDVRLETELGESYGRYAQTIILDRAIPDARDGLKPVQRRIVYAMADAGNTPDKPYRKCAKTVGDVMGNYHPHGDQSIYEALVRLAQPWKMRHPLVDGHGNFGSIDDDPAAAMRYTEARLAGVAMELVRDLEKDTVEWRPNFDEKELEPVVLPCGFPNLLVNGAAGVSTGFATDIPPHNLREVTDAAVALLRDPSLGVSDLMQHVKGPDFPTGGVLMGAEGLREAYETGRGKVVLESRWVVEKQRDGKQLVVITEIPYGVVKSRLVADMDALRTDKTVQGVLDVRDESDREGMRIVIELSKAVDPEGVLAVFLKKTELKINYNFNMVAIHEATPRQMGLRDLLLAYLDHRVLVVRRRSEHDLAKARERIHIVEGLIRAVDILDEIIATIRGSDNRADARDNLVEGFGFSEAQADAILDLRLHRLTGLQILQLREEEAALSKEIARLEAILADERKLRAVVERELRAVAATFGNDRRTEIHAQVRTLEVTLEAVVKPVEVVVGVTAGGYIRRSSMASFRASGETLRDAGAREGDYTRWAARTNTTHKVLVLTRGGTCFTIPVHQLPDHKWGDAGTALVNVVPFGKDDAVVAMHAVDDFGGEESLVFVTEQGMVKRVALGDLDAARSSGIIAMGLRTGDGVARVLRTGGAEHLLIVTTLGQAIRFAADDIAVQGRAAQGVRGIGLDRGDRVATALLVVSPEGEASRRVAVITTEGKAKATPLAEYNPQLRAGKGIRSLKRLLKNPHRIVEVLCLGVEPPPAVAVLADGSRHPLDLALLRTTTRDGNAFTLLEVKQRLVAVLPELEPVTEAGPSTSGGSNGGAEHRERPPEEGVKPTQFSLFSS
ncbi:MAG: DNA gyrase subunit A [Myxococcales bacterium]